MLKNHFIGLAIFTIYGIVELNSQTTALQLQLSIYDYPQNNLNYPSMAQADEMATNVYELGFYGINALGDRIFEHKPAPSKSAKLVNAGFQYGLGFVFSKYGSELPIPLGVWAHEAYHCAVLKENGIDAKNGNWLLNRWDGTVYGASDEDLSTLKSNNLPGLLYAYTSGIQSEINLTRINTINDVYRQRTAYKNPFYLYNALYVYNYFTFSTGPFSDTVKNVAPEFESDIAADRDFAGADLTAWAYDMFNPNEPYTNRDSFPDGEGVNRRIGFSDLSQEAQQFLMRQKELSLINFLNPAILGINRISINSTLSFNLFAQYAPTHFGNDISILLPFSIKQNNLLIGIHNYTNFAKSFYGFEAFWQKPSIINKLDVGIGGQIWSQPLAQDFYTDKGKVGGAIKADVAFQVAQSWNINISTYVKSAGWILGNPYLEQKAGVKLGMAYRIAQ